MKQYIFVLFFLMPASVLAYQQADTLGGDLAEIVVTGYEGNRSILESPGAISFLRAEDIRLFDSQSLVAGLNTISGLRMDERAPGSYRISIRGSSLRSPFGVRNVKIYWNGIPLTEPSGSTPLNLLDPINIKRVEVVKGPAGSVYGAGNGGALLMESAPSLSGNEIRSSLEIGSYRFYRQQVEAINQFESGSMNIAYADHQSDGYRDQSFLNRKVVEASGRFILSPERVVKASMLYSDLYYGIPGGLTENQFEEDPRQDRPGNPFVLGSTEANASVSQQYLLAGFTHDYKWNDIFANTTMLYGSASKFENPFNLDYKKDSRKSWGGRTKFTADTYLGDIRNRFTLGGEFQIGENVARNFENDSSEVGALNFDDEISIRQTLVFANTELDLPHEWYLTLGLSYNQLNYKINRLIDNLNNNPGLVETSFKPNVIPRVALLKKLNSRHSLYGSLSFGFSPPTIEEVRTNEGSINLGLQAEEGTSYELGARGSDRTHRFRYDLAVYYFRLDETIVQYQSGRGTTLFRNAGNTRQYGVEAMFNYDLIRNAPGLVEWMKVSTSYTFQLFEYQNYVQNGIDYSGNRLPGVAPHTLVSTFQLLGAGGWYLNLFHNFTEQIPLNDANTEYSDPYNLIKAKLGWKGELTGQLGVELYLGMDNLLDEHYSLGYDTNAFGNRFYQPAPERNWFGGLKVNYSIGN